MKDAAETEFSASLEDLSIDIKVYRL